ncbi:FliM/FliN family flagellar motor switch protein, partial [Escherichia coli]|nr:FliM/FliN family flagellar motor switch protein [Escherichia coli]
VPHVTLEPIISKLSVHYWMQSSKKEPNELEVEQIRTQVQGATVPVVAMLGQTDISIEDFLSLDKGDIIRLDRGVNQPLIV